MCDAMPAGTGWSEANSVFLATPKKNINLIFHSLWDLHFSFYRNTSSHLFDLERC